MRNKSPPSAFLQLHILHVQQGQRYHPSYLHRFGYSRPPPLTPAAHSPQPFSNSSKKKKHQQKPPKLSYSMESGLISQLNLDLLWYKNALKRCFRSFSAYVTIVWSTRLPYNEVLEKNASPVDQKAKKEGLLSLCKHYITILLTNFMCKK